MPRRRLILLSTVAFLTVTAATHAADEKKITYDEHVKPIFQAKCFGCHNTDKKTADLDLSSYTAMMGGGASGDSVVPGSADDSYLFNLVNHDSEPFMPPKQEKMAAASVDTIRKWIDGGALENSKSKYTVKKKTNEFALKGAPTGKPDGPAAMPDVLNLQPVTQPTATTAVTALATSPWAPLVAVAGQKQVSLYHSETLQPLGILPYPEGVPHVLKFSRNGSLLLAGGGRGSFQGRVVVWDVKTGERVFEVGNEVDAVLAADISADQSMIALGSPSKVVRVYSTADGELLHEIRKHTDWIYSLEFSPDGILLATGDRNGGLHVWESMTGREYLTLAGHKGAITSVSFRSDSNVLASSSEDQSVKLWELENGGQIKTWNAHSGGTSSVEFCRDGRVATCGRDKSTKIWDQAGKQIRAFEAFSDLALRVTHCDETDRMIAGDWTGEVRVWNVADGKRLGDLKQNPPTIEARISVAQTEFKQWNDQATPRAAEFKKAETGLQTVQAEISKANQLVATATQTQKTVKPQIDVASKLVVQLQAIVNSNTKLEQSLKVAVPQLKTAATSAQAAASGMTDDKALEAAVNEIQKQLTAKQADLTKTTQLLAAKRAEMAAAAASLAAMKKQMADAAAQMNIGKATQARMTPQLKPAQEVYSKAKQATLKVKSGIEQATVAVTRWNEYKALHSELAVLAERQKEFDQVAQASAEAEGMLSEVKTVVATMTKATTDIDVQMKATAGKVSATQAVVTQHQAAIAASAAKIAQVNQTIPILKESLAKAKEATKLMVGDAGIAAAVAAIEKSIGDKTAQVPVLQKQMADKQAAMAVATKSITDMKAANAALALKLTATRAGLVQKQAAVMQAQAKVTEVKAKVEVVTAKVNAARSVVENRRQRIRPVLDQKQANAG